MRKSAEGRGLETSIQKEMLQRLGCRQSELWSTVSCGQQSDVITNQSGRYAMNDRSSEVRAQLTPSTKASGTVKNSSWTTSDYKNSRVRLLFEANSPTDTSGIPPLTWRKRLRKRGKLGNTSLLPQGTPDFCTLVYRTHFLKPP